MGRLRFAIAAAWALCGGALSAAGETGAIVPDTRAFLVEVRENLKSDELILDQYTFTEVFKESRLDSSGGVKKSKTEVYEVYPSNLPGKTYRRLISRDGKALSEAELAEQDRKQEEKTDKRERRLAAEDEQKRAARLEEEKRKEKAVVDEIFRMSEATSDRNETQPSRRTPRFNRVFVPLAI